MEERVREGTNLDVELPSFVDDMCVDIIDREGDNGVNMQSVEVGVGGIVREVAEECRLPLETDKEEILHLRTSRKKKNADRKYVKWSGVIFDDSLDFDMHWKSRLAKARKALGALAEWGVAMGDV